VDATRRIQLRKVGHRAFFHFLAIGAVGARKGRGHAQCDGALADTRIGSVNRCSARRNINPVLRVAISDLMEWISMMGVALFSLGEMLAKPSIGQKESVSERTLADAPEGAAASVFCVAMQQYQGVRR
jgi:hypothetical protein